MSTLEESRLEQINHVLSEKIESIRLNYEGADNLIAEVNQEWIFRFPRNARSQKILQEEMKLLAYLTPKLPLPIPQYEYVDKSFVVYRKLNGTALTKQLFDALDQTQQVALSHTIAEFLIALHDTIEEIPTLIEMPKNLNNFWSTIWPVVEEQLPIQCSVNVKYYLKAASQFPHENKLVHGDFKFKHILFDGKNISGVLDFGCATIGDPAQDIGRISERYGVQFMRTLLSSYMPGRQDQTIAERSEYYRRRGLCFLVFDHYQPAIVELKNLFG